MRIKNEYVKIQIGNKTYIKKNMILDTYLHKIFESQINPSFTLQADIKVCYIKLDTPLQNIDYDSELSSNSFDFILENGITSMIEQEKNFLNNSIRTNDTILIDYKFTSDGDFQYKESGSWQDGKENEISMFDGRKIANIGFGNASCYAILDVSDLNIILNSNEQLIITRSDLYQSDGICKGFDYPLHLVNFTAKHNAKDVDGIESCQIAELYSIGLGNIPGLMTSGTETEISSLTSVIDDNSIVLDPREYIEVGIYPSETLFPSNSLFPIYDTSKYIILRYKLYEIDSVYNQKTDLNKDYTMSIKKDMSMYNRRSKTINFKLKIERL